MGLLIGKVLTSEIVRDTFAKNKAMKILCILALTMISWNSFSQNSNGMTKDESIEIIRYKISADQKTDFETAYAKAGEFLKASPYCSGYEVIHGVEEPQHYIVRIHWTSMDDHLQKFRNSQEFKSFFNLVRPFYNAIEEMKHYQSTTTTWKKS
jgi:heme-degrading monooxygenase HmoA